MTQIIKHQTFRKPYFRACGQSAGFIEFHFRPFYAWDISVDHKTLKVGHFLNTPPIVAMWLHSRLNQGFKQT